MTPKDAHEAIRVCEIRGSVAKLAGGGVVSASFLNAKPAVGGIGVEPRAGGVLRVLFTVASDAVADVVVRNRCCLSGVDPSAAVFDVLSDREEAQHRAQWPAFVAAKAAGKRAQFHRARLVVDGERAQAQQIASLVDVVSLLASRVPGAPMQMPHAEPARARAGHAAHSAAPRAAPAAEAAQPARPAAAAAPVASAGGGAGNGAACVGRLACRICARPLPPGGLPARVGDTSLRRSFVLSIPVARGANWFLAGGGRRMDEEEATAAAAERIAAAAEDGTSLPVRLATDVVRFLYGGTGRREPADGGVVSASLLNAKPAVGGIGVEPRGGGVLRVLFTVASDAVADTVVRWRHELRRCVDSTAVFDVLSDREEAQHQALWPAFLAAKVAGKRAQFHRARLVVDGERAVADAAGALVVTPAEVRAAATHSKPGTAPGPDGIPVDVWRKLGEPAFELLAAVFTAVGATGGTPPGFLDGVVASIYKAKNAADAANYRPLTMLGSDYRILAKVLATRWTPLLSAVVGPEQTAFLAGRRISDNIFLTQMLPGLLAANAAEGVGPTGAALALLDFRKAYDTIDRGFLIAVMEAVGVGDGVLAWTRTILTHTYASAEVNGFISAPALGPVARITGRVQTAELWGAEAPLWANPLLQLELPAAQRSVQWREPTGDAAGHALFSPTDAARWLVDGLARVRDALPGMRTVTDLCVLWAWLAAVAMVFAGLRGLEAAVPTLWRMPLLNARKEPIWRLWPPARSVAVERAGELATMDLWDALASFAEGGGMPRGWAGVVGPTHPFVGVVDGGLTLNKTS
ncbi:hypothetical protein FOA52_002273 [Chlamydomonas sp. UWO 241]|nr:hypothetical protein FOA52_002273 [Chlamydomonas sp. UWO 241]